MQFRQPIEFTEFKVKRYWWKWALGIILHLLLAGVIRAGGVMRVGGTASSLHIIVIIIFLIDVLLIFPEASHFRYVITDREIIIKRLIYPDITIPFVAVTEVNNAALFSLTGGFGLKIGDEVLTAYKITYTSNNFITGRKKYSNALIYAKDRKKFIGALESRIDPHMILINSTESAFKKKIDKKDKRRD